MDYFLPGVGIHRCYGRTVERCKLAFDETPTPGLPGRDTIASNWIEMDNSNSHWISHVFNMPYEIELLRIGTAGVIDWRVTRS
jgi:hypothetical protein